MVEMTATAYRDERGSCALSYEPNFLARDFRPNDTSPLTIMLLRYFRQLYLLALASQTHSVVFWSSVALLALDV
jgi:hypothetical protein